MLMKVKVKVSDDKKKGMVYEIQCRDCEHAYLGETKRTLKRRIVEHKQAVKKFDEKKGMVYEIQCRDCEHAYLGETKRTLKRRIVEHKQAVKKFDEKNGMEVHANYT